MKPDADVVVANRHGLTRIGHEGIGFAAVNDLDDFPFELGLFFDELGLAFVVFVDVLVVVVEVVEEEVLEGLSDERVVDWSTKVEPSHECLEEKVVHVAVVAEGTHGV